jgi:hypothetical protein
MLTSALNTELIEARSADIAEHASRHTAMSAFRSRTPRRALASVYDGVSVRIARAGDLDVARLAALDESDVPEGRALVAMRDGKALAAVPVDGGEAVADPFERTAALVEVLHESAKQMREATSFERRRRSIIGRRRLVVAGSV